MVLREPNLSKKMLYTCRVMMKGKMIGLNETMLGLVAPLFFVGMYSSVLGNHRAELALALGTMFSSEDAFKYGERT